MLISGVLAVVLLIVGYGVYYLYYIPINYVGIDINPSIQLTANRLNRVVEAISLNEEGDILLSDLNLVNMTVEEASETIVASATELGYIDEISGDNAVVISVSSEDEEKVEEIEEGLSNRVERFLTNKKIPALVLLEKDNAERKVLADEYGISYGKMVLIQKAVVLNPELIEAELVDMPIQDIAKNIKDARIEIKEARKTERKQELVQRKEEIRNTYRKEYNKAIQSIINKDDRINNNITEEQKEQIKKEIIEARKEAAKDAIEKVKEELKSDWSKVDNNTGNANVPAPIKERIETIKDRWNNRAR